MPAVAKGRKRATPAPAAAPPLSRRRRIAFTAITLALPLLLLVLVEVGLRLGGYGGTYPLFVEYPARPEYLQTNPDVARRYFRQDFVPTPEVEFFRATKLPGTFRIVFQGESSAQGFPYGHGAAPSRMLKQRLEATLADTRVEVVNTALTAVNSFVLVDLADEIIARRPDAVMIYTGHNEYYGVFGVGSTRGFGGARPIVKTYLALDGLRIVQLLGAAIGKVAGAFGAQAGDGRPRTVMEAMAGEQTVPYGSRRYQRGIDQFRANLRALLGRYRSARIPVFIGTIASNERDQKPFVSSSTGADTSADGYFALARAADQRGDSATARPYYRAAKERDELRFRAPEAINRVIREEAARSGATVVETQRALERASPGGVVGGTLMLEHVHPNVDGYFLIADAFYEALREKGTHAPRTVPLPAPRARQDLLVTPLDSLVGLLRTDRLLSAWPFQPRGASRVPVVDTMRPRTPAERLAQAVVLGNLPWPEAMERLRVEFERAGQPDEAIRIARSMAAEYSYSAEPLMDAARLALVLRRYEEALRYVRAANDRQETVQTANLLGLLLLRHGDHAGGLRQLRRAAQLAPRNERLGITVTAAEAIPNLERERTRSPRDANLLYNLAAAYAITQQYDKATEALGVLERVEPAHAGARDLRQRLASVSP